MIVPVREDVLVEAAAVTVTLVVPLEPLVFDNVIHEGVLMVSQLKLEVMVTLSDPPSAVKLREDTLAEMASDSTGFDDDGVPNAIPLGIESSVHDHSIIQTAAKYIIFFIMICQLEFHI